VSDVPVPTFKRLNQLIFKKYGMNVMPLLATNLVILNFLQKNNNMTDM
jgi:hypothetical protein